MFWGVKYWNLQNSQIGMLFLALINYLVLAVHSIRAIKLVNDNGVIGSNKPNLLKRDPPSVSSSTLLQNIYNWNNTSKIIICMIQLTKLQGNMFTCHVLILTPVNVSVKVQLNTCTSSTMSVSPLVPSDPMLQKGDSQKNTKFPPINFKLSIFKIEPHFH